MILVPKFLLSPWNQNRGTLCKGTAIIYCCEGVHLYFVLLTISCVLCRHEVVDEFAEFVSMSSGEDIDRYAILLMVLFFSLA
jgi:hypothetical protein